MTDDKAQASTVPNGGFVTADHDLGGATLGKKLAAMLDDDLTAPIIAGLKKMIGAAEEPDLVDRCLRHADILTDDNWHTEAATLREAAAEIQRLRLAAKQAEPMPSAGYDSQTDLPIQRPSYTGVSG